MVAGEVEIFQKYPDDLRNCEKNEGERIWKAISFSFASTEPRALIFFRQVADLI